MTQKSILIEKTGDIATIIFNRPEAMNSFNHAMAEEFEAATRAVLFDKSIRAVCLAGNGKLFMAGGDLHYFHEHRHDLGIHAAEIIRLLNSAVLNLRALDKPLVGRAHGSVAGVGLSLLLACDLVIAAENTKFTTAYSKIGLSCDGGVSSFLPAIVGQKKAMELLFLSDVLSSQQALQLGLINFVVAEDQLITESSTLLNRLASMPTVALAQIRGLVQNSQANSLEKQLERECHAFLKCAGTEDFQQGLSAFLEKRKVTFAGK